MRILIPFLICTLSILTSWISAAEVSVLTDSAIAKIYINRELKGTENVIRSEMDPGTYLVEVFEGDTLIYSKMITVSDLNQTVVVNRISGDLATQLKDKDLASKQANYVLSKKPRFGAGAGLHYAGASGFMLHHDRGRHAHQGVFWLTNFSDHQVSHLGYRYIRYFKNHVTGQVLVRPYIGASAGMYHRKTKTYKTDAVIFELPVGVQLSRLTTSSRDNTEWTPAKIVLAIYAFPLYVANEIAKSFNKTTNIDLYIESGLMLSQVNSNDPTSFRDYVGFKIGSGLVYYF